MPLSDVAIRNAKQREKPFKMGDSLVRGVWPDRASAIRAADKLPAAAYLLDERHIMVANGKPTPVGLRGLDAVRTIEEAGADNQLSDAVVRAVYGVAAAP